MDKKRDPWNGDRPPTRENIKAYAAKQNASKKRPTEEEMGKKASLFFTRKFGASTGEANRAENLAKKMAESKMDKELARRAAQAERAKKKRPGESDAAYKKRLRNMTYGNPNE